MEKKLSNPNPYDVLGVSQSASNAEITKAFAMAMKRREYSPDVIAKARKSLMNPQERLIADFLRPILPPINRFKRNFSAWETPALSLEFLSEFDGLEEMRANLNQISETDKRLGSTLFSSSPIQSPPLKSSASVTSFSKKVIEPSEIPLEGPLLTSLDTESLNSLSAEKIIHPEKKNTAPKSISLKSP